ncbi:MAG: glycosyltransferase family 9 protein [Gemmatimonadaceae bacterium]
MSIERGRKALLESAFRHKKNYALGLASEIAAPLMRPVARMMTRAPSPPASWKKGLIIAHNHIGDVLYRTASLQALRSGLPNCEWSFLTSPSTADMLLDNPHIAEVLPWNDADDSWNIAPAFKRELTSRRFDAVVCSNTLRHYPDFMLAVSLGIPNRIGFTYKGLSGLITHPVGIDFPSPYAGYFRTIVADLVGRAPEWSLSPEIFLSQRDSAEAQRLIASAGLGAKPIVACSLTTRQSRGNWPVSFMIAALVEARRSTDFDVVLCGGPGDRQRLTQYKAEIGDDVHVIAGDLSLRGFAMFLRHCRVLFTLDSGPRHLGNAVATRVLFARNMSHSQVEAGAYCSSEMDIAPAGEYLSDAEISRVAATMSPSAVARQLSEPIRSGAKQA